MELFKNENMNSSCIYSAHLLSLHKYYFFGLAFESTGTFNSG